MHYYQHNIGDYARDTGHLSVIEHGVYRLLLDWCYLNEKPITTEQAMRVGRGNPEATQSVLSEFFVACEDGWRHKRVDSEIAKYHQQAEKNRINGLKGGRKKPIDNPVGSESVATGGPNQEPITNNQKPIVKERTRSPSGSRLPADWVLPADWQEWAESERPDLDVTTVAYQFRDYWIAKPGKDGRKLDWQATWRNWIRGQRKEPPKKQPAPTYAQQDEMARRRRWEEMTGRKWPEDGQADFIDVDVLQIGGKA